MSYYEDWHVNSLDRNREIVRKTIRPATAAGLKDLGGHGVGVIQPKGAKMIDEVIDAT
jgi:hypothetical protein